MENARCIKIGQINLETDKNENQKKSKIEKEKLKIKSFQ